jgi:hypothetical protein
VKRGGGAARTLAAAGQDALTEGRTRYAILAGNHATGIGQNSEVSGKTDAQLPLVIIEIGIAGEDVPAIFVEQV